MYALITLHDENYQSLADLTWHDNKLVYAEMHGYAAHALTDNVGNPKEVGYQKIHFAKKILDEHPEYEWIWWTGTDTMITNMFTRIEDRINNNYHFIICVDVNGINADSFLVKNTPEGRKFLDDVIAIQDQAMQNWDTEQWAISHLLGFPGTGLPGWPFGEDLKITNQYANIVKIMPQRYMNSFNYLLYHYQDHRDKLGWDGNWQLGDWLIHWPACSLEYRIQLAEYYREHIIQ